MRLSYSTGVPTEYGQLLLRERLQDPTADLGITWASRFVKRRPELRTRYN